MINCHHLFYKCLKNRRMLKKNILYKYVVTKILINLLINYNSFFMPFWKKYNIYRYIISLTYDIHKSLITVISKVLNLIGNDQKVNRLFWDSWCRLHLYSALNILI